MADITPKYKFLLNSSEIQMPLADNEFGYEWEKVDETFYFRKKLSKNIKFSLSEYVAIQTASVEDLFIFTVQKYGVDGYENDFVGEFYKTDCVINEDDKYVTVKPSPADGYEEFKRVLNNEYNLIDLNPIATPILYTIRPILQIVSCEVNAGVYRTPSITNIVGGSYWEETLDDNWNPDSLIAFGFDGTPESEIIFTGVYYYQRYLTVSETFNGVATSLRAPVDISAVSFIFNKTSKEVSTS
jgi:hypothetical protein